MPKQIDYTLTEDELEQVSVAMKSKKVQVARRASVVHSLHLGYKPEEVAKLHQVSVATVYNNFNRFRAEGKSGLVTKPISGRPPKADATYRQRLTQLLETDPQTLGLGFSLWTLPSLQAYMERHSGVRLSQNRISEVLQEEGYVYRRPKKDLGHKHDPLLREQVQQALKEVKKVPKAEPSAYSIWMKVE